MRPGTLGVAVNVAYALRDGLLRLPQETAEPRLAAVAQFLRPLQMLPFDDECALQAAKIRIVLEAAGTPIGPHDTLIAATTMRHQATLITRHAREYSRVSGLRWINWHDDRPALKP